MDIKQQLIEGAKVLNVELTDKQADQLMRYKELLVEWNEKMNLTAITEDMEVITKHFLDCLTVQSSIDLAQVKSLVDVGTGAGFPGLVLKILQHVIDELGLTGIECVHGRAEDLGKNKAYREQFEVCASRAVANLAVLSEYTLPFVKKGGYLIALKGQKLDEELAEGEKAITILGGTIDKLVDVVVPYTDLNHRIAKIKKVKETPKKYPRKAGEPTKAPLGK